jgi:hypothetical protein
MSRDQLENRLKELVLENQVILGTSEVVEDVVEAVIEEDKDLILDQSDEEEGL